MVERVAEAVETAEERRAAQARTQQQDPASLTAQTPATERLERQTMTFLGWSRTRWQCLLVGMVLTLVLGGLVRAGYWLVGLPSALEAEVALYRRLWGVTTEAERARIQERL